MSSYTVGNPAPNNGVDEATTFTSSAGGFDVIKDWAAGGGANKLTFEGVVPGFYAVNAPPIPSGNTNNPLFAGEVTSQGVWHVFRGGLSGNTFTVAGNGPDSILLADTGGGNRAIVFENFVNFQFSQTLFQDSAGILSFTI